MQKKKAWKDFVREQEERISNSKRFCREMKRKKKSSGIIQLLNLPDNLQNITNKVERS